MSVLAIDGLGVRFEGQPDAAVDDATLHVDDAEIVALVGESGSGKSVTARAVLGLLPPTARVTGSVRVVGREVVGLDERSLRGLRGARVSMVFQEPATALNPVETVGWQLREVLRARGRGGGRRARRARAIDLLRLVALPEPERSVGHYPHQLSGGQRQRVAIALALAGEPDLLIADEPTTALDVTVQSEILALLRDLRDRTGLAILVITHNLGVVADLADRAVVLRHGKVVETAPVEQLFAQPRAPYTQSLLAAVPRLDVDRPAAVEVHDPAASLAAVELRGVSAAYPGRLGRPPVVAAHGVDLTVARGEVLGLVGESGSGKSTLGRVAIGLLPPSAGTVRVLGHDLAAASAAQRRAVRRRIGVVFQDPATSLDPLRTVGDAVGEPLALHRGLRGASLRAGVGELLEAVQLPAEHAHRYPGELSGGQRQRIGLARALALDPELVIADEPTSALDVTVQAAVLDLFRELHQQHRFACLFVSHDLAVVDDICDRVALLADGRLVEQGPPAQVLRRPVTEAARRLVAAVPIPDPAAQRARRAGVVPTLDR